MNYVFKIEAVENDHLIGSGPANVIATSLEQAIEQLAPRVTESLPANAVRANVTLVFNLIAVTIPSVNTLIRLAR